MTLNSFNKTHQPWYSEIADTKKDISNIYLGAIPLKNKGHIEAFQAHGIDSVLSLLEPFEYQETFFSSPVREKDWESCGIKQLKIKAKNFLPLEIDEIDAAVAFLRDEINANRRVYVHCKAGKGRSVTAVCCYLISEKGMTAQEAIDFVQSKRPNINLNKHQRKRIYEYADKIKKERQLQELRDSLREEREQRKCLNSLLGFLKSNFNIFNLFKSFLKIRSLRVH